MTENKRSFIIKEKVVKVFDQESSWSNIKSNSIVGIKLIQQEGRKNTTVEFTQLKGPAIDLAALENIILGDFDILKYISKSLRLNNLSGKKVYPEVIEKTSGRIEAALYQVKNSNFCAKGYTLAQLDVSMYGKPYLDTLGEIKIMDLVELLRSIDKEFEDRLLQTLISSKKIIRARRSKCFTYVKPYQVVKRLDMKTLFEGYIKRNPDKVHQDIKSIRDINGSIDFLFMGETNIHPDGTLQKVPFFKSSQFDPEGFLSKNKYGGNVMFIKITNSICYETDGIKFFPISLDRYREEEKKQGIIPCENINPFEGADEYIDVVLYDNDVYKEYIRLSTFKGMLIIKLWKQFSDSSTVDIRKLWITHEDGKITIDDVDLR